MFPPLSSAWSLRVFAPLCASLARCSVAAHCALLRVLATPALRASDVRKLTRGAPCFTGLIGGYCTLNSQWSSCCALRLAVLPPLSSAWSPLCVRKAHLRCFLLHWAHRRLLQPLAAPPLSPSLGSSYRPALRWPGIPGLRSASRCPRPFTPSGLRRQRPVSRTARGLRAPRRRRPSVPALRTACARASSRFAASNGQRPGRECIFPANASICSAKNARNDVHAVISDLSLVLPILCQCSEREAGIGPPPFVKKRASHASGGRSLKTPGDCPARENMV